MTTDNTPEAQVISLARKMRTAQKIYFRTKDPVWLQESKKFEKELDAALEQLGDLKPTGQTRLDLG